MNQQIGKQSIQLKEMVYILGEASVVGKKEGEGPLGERFDMIGEDPMFGCSSWEEAESTLQKEALGLALGKTGYTGADIRYLLAGDLLAQSVASSFGIMDFEIPLLGLYGACSTIGEALSLSAMLIGGGYAMRTAALTSSHYASAEKEFRFPLAYGNQRPLSASWTVTGSGAFILGKESGSCGITGITTGKIVDYGCRDSQNMGACMAPAAADTICQNFVDFDRSAKEYDRIVTGDLGSIGSQILCELLEKEKIDIEEKHLDCGSLIYDTKEQDTHAGGSGCGCAATVLAAYILPMIRQGVWKRVLFVPTGALLSKVSYNEGQSVPGIAHGVVLECSKKEVV